MTDTSGRDATLEYRAALASCARDEVVARAEETVSAAWIAELDAERRRLRAASVDAVAARRWAGLQVRWAQRAAAERDKRILMMRYFRGMTQGQVSAEIGVSQMQVSRILARILRDLRAGPG